ncbi:MAG: enoyl-CoA hydratase/isomerase family protein [Herminiimonas sp.]|nr:enoyl-CoA hydratase/isomerase family protein [Herminiimonas sp.]
MAAILVTREGAIATVTLSNPGKLNAIDVAMWGALAARFTELSADESLRCVIVRGEGGQFAAGADIAEFSQVRNTLEQGIRYHTDAIGQALTAISGCRHPTIAAIDGVCAGGGLEIACACDLRLAAPDALFGIPINRLGFALAPDEMAGLLQLVGKAVTLELLLEGRIFDAAEALQKGLLTRIVADVPSEALAAAERIAAGAPLAARMNKLLVARLTASPAPLEDDELRAAFTPLASDDYREGVAAFLAKRRARFAGK